MCPDRAELDCPSAKEAQVDKEAEMRGNREPQD
jgi:hypothetical protein